jgi:hypothetical protein
MSPWSDPSARRRCSKAAIAVPFPRSRECYSLVTTEESGEDSAAEISASDSGRRRVSRCLARSKGTILPDAAGAHCGGLCGGRRDRPCRAPDGSVAVRAARPAIRHREPDGRRNCAPTPHRAAHRAAATPSRHPMRKATRPGPARARGAPGTHMGPKQKPPPSSRAPQINPRNPPPQSRSRGPLPPQGPPKAGPPGPAAGDRAATRPQRRRHTEPPARAAGDRAAGDRAASDRAATRCPRPPPAGKLAHSSGLGQT